MRRNMGLTTMARTRFDGGELVDSDWRRNKPESTSGRAEPKPSSASSAWQANRVSREGAMVADTRKKPQDPAGEEGPDRSEMVATAAQVGRMLRNDPHAPVVLMIYICKLRNHRVCFRFVENPNHIGTVAERSVRPGVIVFV